VVSVPARRDLKQAIRQLAISVRSALPLRHDPQRSRQSSFSAADRTFEPTDTAIADLPQPVIAALMAPLMRKLVAPPVSAAEAH
jgi:hypothetical protein